MSATDPESGHGTVQGRPPSEHGWFVRLLVAVVVLFISAGLFLGAPDRPDAIQVPVDGQPHTVAVSAYSSTVLHTDAPDDEPACGVADPESGQALAVAPPSRSESFSGEVPDGYVTFLAFTPSTDTVEVTCSDSAGEVVVAAEGPGTPYLVARYGGATLLLVIGLGLLASAVVSLRRLRSPTP